VTRRILALLAAVALACGGGGEPAGGDAAPAGRPRLAGVSVRLRYAVQPLAPGELAADTAPPLRHFFEHRCSACHAAPSPRQLPAASWPRVVERMQGNIEAAGLLPLEDADAARIVELLQRHAR
jgi:hypothetical protein